MGTAPDIRRVVELAHAAGALAWIDAVHYGPHGPIDVAAWGCDVLICSPYKFFGPHMGMAFGREELLRSWRPYKVRPAADEPVGHRFELGTRQHELLAGFVAAIDYVDSLGWDAIVGARARARASGSSTDSRRASTLHGLPTMDGPRADVLLQRAGPQRALGRRAPGRRARSPSGGATTTRSRRSASSGSTSIDGAVRAGIVHYNTAEEVDRLLAALAELV